jgi:hypothetical protein
MPRIGLVTIVGTLAACLFFACGDKNDPLQPVAAGGSVGGGGQGGSDPGIDGGCGQGGAGGGGSTGVSFAADIMPLVEKSCSCHVTGSIAPALGNYAQVKASATASNIAIKDGSMPIVAPLSAAEQALFASWISAGMPNN